MTQSRDLKSFQFALAQLRHAYSHLYAETVVKQRMFATGLLGPAIAEIERTFDRLSEQEEKR